MGENKKEKINKFIKNKMSTLYIDPASVLVLPTPSEIGEYISDTLIKDNSVSAGSQIAKNSTNLRFSL